MDGWIDRWMDGWMEIVIIVCRHCTNERRVRKWVKKERRRDLR